MSNPPEVAARIDRLCAFHEAGKATPPLGTTKAPAQKPSVFRVFSQCPRIPLPTRLLDIPTPALRILAQGRDALPESMACPPQDLKTLASWLHNAAGITGKITEGDHTRYLRAYPSAGASYPSEIYVLALGIRDLEPGFYHFSAKDFSLYRLRGGYEALAQLKRGRPDLEMLKTMPAILLVSSILWRSAWQYGLRAYRYAALDAGHVIENLVQVGSGLGIQTMVRMHLNDRNTRELIGLPKDAGFGQFEIVQGMVAWADNATQPIVPPALRTAPAPLPPVDRSPIAASVTEYPTLCTAHEDCLAPGVAVHEVRPPHTESCPLPEGSQLVKLPSEEVYSDLSLLKTIQKRRSVRSFDPHGISRDYFARVNTLAFAGGTYHPLVPNGAHLGLIRAYWFVHNVTGVQPGLWYYHANFDQFTPLSYGDLRFESKYLFEDQEICQQASAVCVMVANLREAMDNSGPDTYRLAHLEAGIAAERLYLACTALSVECCATAMFRDDELRIRLGLNDTYWQCIHGMAIGGVRRPKTLEAPPTAIPDPTGPRLR